MVNKSTWLEDQEQYVGRLLRIQKGFGKKRFLIAMQIYIKYI